MLGFNKFKDASRTFQGTISINRFVSLVCIHICVYRPNKLLANRSSQQLLLVKPVFVDFLELGKYYEKNPEVNTERAYKRIMDGTLLA